MKKYYRVVVGYRSRAMGQAVAYDLSLKVATQIAHRLTLALADFVSGGTKLTAWVEVSLLSESVPVDSKAATS